MMGMSDSSLIDMSDTMLIVYQYLFQHNRSNIPDTSLLINQVNQFIKTIPWVTLYDCASGLARESEDREISPEGLW
jgi:hypothetical protein